MSVTFAIGQHGENHQHGSRQERDVSPDAAWYRASLDSREEQLTHDERVMREQRNYHTSPTVSKNPDHGYTHLKGNSDVDGENMRASRWQKVENNGGQGSGVQNL